MAPWRDRTVVVTGSGGLIGGAWCARLGELAIPVRRLVRRREQAGDDAGWWDPGAGVLDAAHLERAWAVVHLAGRPVARGRWNAAAKREIRDSRVASTRLLATTLAGMRRPPPVWVCASATGYYGDRGDAWLDESSGAGEGFLADVCREWEAATEPAVAAGVRVVRLRFGMVLAPDGGALAAMLPLFRRGLGGPLGGGGQYVSWVALPDVLDVLFECLIEDAMAGPINMTAPEPVTSRQFAAALGRVLGRPAWLPAPAWALRLALGEMAREVVLASARVRPARLLELGYRFRHPEIEGALRAVLAPRVAVDAGE